MRRLVTVLLALGLLAACTTPTPAPTFTPTASPEPTASPTVTETATPSPTVSPLPTPTLPPSPLMSPLSPLATPTPVSSTLFVPLVLNSPLQTPPPPPPEEVHVPILMYHYISELPADADVYRRDLTVVPEKFEAQLAYLQEHGYHTVTLEDIYLALSEGRPLPENPIALTFDDGYEDAYTEAMPLLKKYGYVGTFFLLATPPHYEAPGYMTWKQIAAMAEAGMSMQAHGRDHYDLRGRTYDFLVYQILGAKQAVEAHTGKPVHFFCYPSGRYDDDTQAVVKSAGYWGAVTTAWGTKERLDNSYAWPRIRVRGKWLVNDFASVLAELRGD